MPGAGGSEQDVLEGDPGHLDHVVALQFSPPLHDRLCI